MVHRTPGSQPHVFVLRCVTKEQKVQTSISEAFTILDMSGAVKDLRRFNYVSKVSGQVNNAQEMDLKPLIAYCHCVFLKSYDMFYMNNMLKACIAIHDCNKIVVIGNIFVV